MTIKEVAAHADVCEAIVRAWVKSGLLPHYRLGAPGRRGKITVKVEDLNAFLASQRVEKAAPAPKVTKPKAVFRHLNVR
jgi:predicted site-specific integrase-resolvase